MKGVDTIARIRREFFVRGKSIKEIVREQHVSRSTVRKVLRSGASDPGRTSVEALVEAVRGIGYEARPSAFG